MAFDEEQLRGLSANEREALMEAEDDEDVIRELGGAGDDAPRQNRSELSTEKEDPDAEADAAATAAAQPEGIVAEVEADEDDAPAAPTLVAPSDIAEQRAALNAREDESMQKLLDGEITQEEHATTKNEVRAKLEELIVAQATDSATQAIERNAMMKDYTQDLRETVKLGKAAGLDYKGDEKLAAQFDRAVRMFSNQFAEEGLYDAPGNLANSKQALAEAHAYMLRRHGKAAPSAAQTPAAPATPAKGPRAAPDRSQIPPTLSQAPAAADARITSEFAHLDGINEPAELERQLARLTPEQQERYLG